MQFRKVTENKYVGESGYSLIYCKSTNSFCINKDNKVTEWGSYFVSVKAAENFINSHDYIHASNDLMLMNMGDVISIIDMYGTKCLNKSKDDELFDEWAINNHYSIKGDWIEDCEERGLEGADFPVIKLYKDGALIQTYHCPQLLIRDLDRIVNDNIFASVILRGKSLRVITAARDRKSSREISRNLIRVKSSNVWAYGVEIKDNKATEGDVYIQFKGKNGGPGDIYKYYDVPVSLWRKFIGAPSKGHFFWKYLRNNFLYSKLTGNKIGKLPNAINH